MKEQRNKAKMIVSILLVLAIISSILLGTKLLSSISFGSETQELLVEAEVEKYINYQLSDQDKGTLVQYRISQKMENGNTYVPVKSSEMEVSLNQLDGKYPQKVKAIAKETKVTNGKTNGIEENYQYDANTGKITIKANNQNEQGEIIYKDQPNQEAKDEYIILCYYDTYVEENPERNLKLDISAKATLAAQDDITIHTNHTMEVKVDQNVGTITSVQQKVEDLYNGYIKSNKMNGTDYNTTYQEEQEIMISKKEAQEELEISEESSFIKVGKNQEEIATVENNGNLIYKSSKIKKENLTKLLGEEGTIQILDKNQNVLETIQKNSPWEEDGTITIQYENGTEGISLKTSKILEEGILSIEHTKEIKNTMTDLENTKIKTVIGIAGIEEKIEQIVDLKEAQTNVKMEVNNAEWTNKQQNEITFDIILNASTPKDNLFKNPEIRVELPEQVEKVILQNSSIFHNNGLELQEPYIETNANGNTVMVAKLTGAQTAYSENELELSTDVKITATIILKQGIESMPTSAKVSYTNQYTADGSIETGNCEIPLKIENYQEEQIKPIIQEEVANFNQAKEVENKEEVKVEGLKLEVAPVKGETNLTNGNIIYEGEYIKYNVKITNTSDKSIENIKVVGNIPEGTKYGELKADYEEVRGGEYTYQFDETISTKEIEIGTLAPGQSIQKYYEVQAKDLEQGQTEKEIISNIKAYVGQTEVATYETTNKIQPAEAKIFLGCALGNTTNQWFYKLSVESKTPEVVVKLKAPKEFTLMDIVLGSDKQNLEQMATIGEDNEMTLKIQSNQEYWLIGYVKTLETTQETENSKAEITAIASVELNNSTYQSNENRLIFSYPSVSIAMTSSNEGEEVKYGEEINYEIKVTNTGKITSMDPASYITQVNITDFLPEYVNPVSITYDNWEQEKEEVDADGSYKPIGKFHKLDPVTENIDGIITDSNGKRLADVNLILNIPYQESVTIQVKTTAGMVYEKTKIENSANVTAVGKVEEIKEIDGLPVVGTSSQIRPKTSNIITHTILPYNYEEIANQPEIPEKPEEPNTNHPVQNPDKPNQPVETEAKYNIAGTAWLDENEDGQRKANEKTLSGIPVMLVDAKNATIVKDNVKTGADGSYQFTDVEKGDYVVVFQYDTNRYRVTQFQKNGVPNSSNSDAITKEIPLNGQNMKVGVIDITNLQSSVSNMDIGMVENKICDFKLDKYITKVTVTTNKGTKQYNYQDQQLAKVEIRAQEIEGATVVMEYKIVVTNEGELPATVGKVIDYLPEGLTFSSELNKSWSSQTNGQLINTSLSNRKMEAGESVELTLIATKKMTSSSTGTFTNAAEIGDISNSLNIKDTDSTPANKVKTEDDYSEAEVILSVSTGLMVYVSIGTFLVIMVGIALFLAQKHGILKLGKMSLFATILVVMLLSTNKSFAEAPASDVFNRADWLGYYNAFGPAGFVGNLTGSGWCNTPGAAYGSGIRRYAGHNVAIEVTYTIKKAANINFTLEKRKNQNDNYNVRIGELDDNYYLYGPMNFYCDFEGQYTYHVLDGTGQEVAGYVVCDESGNPLDLSNQKGELTFYIKMAKQTCEKGISKIELSTTRKDTEIVTETIWGRKNYVGFPYQDVLPDKKFKLSERDITNEKSKTKKIEWTSINSILMLEKVDKDNHAQKIGNVTIKVEREGSDWEKTVITDENGQAQIENVRPGTYRITEVENKNYGYRPEATGEATVQSGAPLKYTLENKKHTGNLTILKKDEATGKAIEGFGFKLKSIDGDLEGNNKGKYIIAIDGNNSAIKTIKGVCHISNLAYTDNIEEATEFVTDSEGKVVIQNILIGNYEVTETSVGYYGYVLEDDYIIWKVQTATGESQETKGKSIVVEVTEQSSENTGNDPSNGQDDNVSTVVQPINKKKYVKLSGYVWVDKIDGKTSERNDKYNADANLDTQDLLFNGIEVRLKDKRTGELVEGLKENPVRTEQRNLYTDIGNNGNGEYLFEDVLIEELDNYYIEFEYDGLTYTNVIPLEESKMNRYQDDEQRSENANYSEEEAQRSSKAAESKENRKAFNQNFSVIKGGETADTGITIDAQGNKKHDLTYDIQQQGGEGTTAQHAIATLKSQGDYTIDEENKVITQNNTTVPYPIVADTTVTTYNIEKNYDYQPETEQIRFINLGLAQREQPDIGIAKDIQNVKVAVNGKTHIYDYAQRFNNSGFTKDFLEKYEGERYNYNEQTKQYEPAEEGEYIKYQSPYQDEEEYVPMSQLIFNVGVRYGIKQAANEQNNGANEGYTAMSYRRAIYRSDYEFTEEDEAKKDNELKVYITYKIKMNIAKGNLYAKINELVDYYDARYELVGYGTKLENYDPTGEGVTKQEEASGQYNENYNKLVLNTEGVGIIGGQTDLTSDDGCVYVQFKLNREAVATILDEPNLDENNRAKDLLNNVVEVTSYSIYDQKEENYEIYAGIDKNSNPGNTNPEDQKTYENDTDASPALQLELADAREMAGKVFEDDVVPQNGKDPKDIMTKEIRQGDGKYKEGENGVGKVEVTLAEKGKESGARIYKTQTIHKELAGKGKYGFIETKGETDKVVIFTPEEYRPENKDKYAYVYDKTEHHDEDLQEGDFFIQGYIPGNYDLTYTWGDETYTVQESRKYTVQDYKGTIYLEKDRQNDPKWWHEDKFKEDGTLQENYNEDGRLKEQNKQNVTRLTDAIDNYEKEQEAPKGSRKQIDAEMNSINTAVEDEIKRTKMDSTTPEMDINVEYDGSDRVYSGSSGDRYTYLIDHLDFGIVERARQQLEISKAVTGVKVTLANGQVLIDATIDPVTGQIDGVSGGLTYGPRSDNSIGFVKLEIDSELIQGATVEVKYTIKEENKGEIDYATERYYTYGEPGTSDDIVKMKPDVYDYLDNSLKLDETNPGGWAEISKNVYTNERIKYEAKGTKVSDTIIEKYYKVGNEVTKDGRTIKEWEIGQKTLSNLLTEWYEKDADTRTVRTVKLDNRTILENPELNKELEPGETKSEHLYTKKLLSNSEEINLNNDVEITEVTRTKTTGTIPKVVTSHIYDRGEMVTVTPPTGEDQNYSMPIIIGVTALIILGAGVVIIKKKVL